MASPSGSDALDPHRIIEFLRDEAGRPLKAGELAKALNVPEGASAAFREQLQRLEDEGVLYRVQRQRYAAPARINLITGRLQTTRGGAGFLIPEDGSRDVFVPMQALNTALDGDRVVVRLERNQRGDRPEGKVIKVLERSRSTVVGVFHGVRPGSGKRASHGFVVPRDSRLPWDVFVAPGGGGAAAEGDIVVVRITDWGSEHRGPTGDIEEVLGRIGEPGVDVLAIMRGRELPTDFPKAVDEAADALRRRGLTADDLRDREDLRDRLIFTIDPADARDHDDALSIERTAGGATVGVHIADVSHYVQEGSVIDTEAAARGTSVYLVDRVVPMLPHALSTDLCSLVPDEDRLTLSVFVDLDAAGAVLGSRLVRGVICSRHKLSYEAAQAVLDGERSIDGDTDRALTDLRDVARTLRGLREARGSLDFDLPEARVVLDDLGEPTDIQKVVRLEAHRMIEDFMLLANETIAQRAAAAKVPFMYRIHEQPDAARMEQVRDFAATFGHRLGSRGSTPGPKDLQRVIAAAAGRSEENLISMVVLRSMKQARYSEQNLGHFGLAARTYTHFTSPIRRYPDLIVHRISAGIWVDGRTPWLDEASLAEHARLASDRERLAVAAERDSKDLKKVEFMERHLNSEFHGTISGVTAFGFFVMLDDFFVDGLVHVSSLEDDYYLFVEEQYALIGERTARRFRVGDRVEVRVAAVDLEERRIDFRLIADESAPAGNPGQRKAGGSGKGRTGGSGRGKTGGSSRGKTGGSGKGRTGRRGKGGRGGGRSGPAKPSH
ncbi:ribonuclease R [soil metagenome]